MLGYQSTILSEFQVPGITIQRAINHWQAGAEISECEPDAVLRWRVKPYRVKIKACAKPGKYPILGN